jgi:hypothetical protein
MKASFKTTSLDEFSNLLKEGIVEFEFIKKDGTVRSAKGTLEPSLLPPAKPAGDSEVAAPRKKNESVFVYYDLEKNAFRSFVKASFLGAY